MNYGEKELLSQRVLGLEKINASRREITFYLNDYTESLDKKYYFCFEQLSNSYLKIDTNFNAESIRLTIGDAELVCGESIFMEKGIYEVAVSTTLSNLQQSLLITISGEVAYYDGCETKVINADGYSVIAQFSAGLLLLYKYDTKVTLIEQLETKSYDLQLVNGEVFLYHLTDTGFERIVYLEDFSASVISEYSLEGLSQIKCSKEGLYVVLSGNLYSITITEEGIEKTQLGLKLKELLAVEDGKAVYRDYDGKIKLCSFSVSPLKIN